MLYDYILQHFTGNDELIRPSLMSPDTQNGYVYASDGHIIIRIPAGRCKKNTKLKTLMTMKTFFQKRL